MSHADDTAAEIPERWMQEADGMMDAAAWLVNWRGRSILKNHRDCIARALASAYRAGDEEGTERAAKIAEDFAWTLPLWSADDGVSDDIEAIVNGASDDAAEAVKGQIASAIRSQEKT